MNVIKRLMMALLLLAGFLIGILFTLGFSAMTYADDWQEQPGNAVTGLAVGTLGVPDRASPQDRVPEKKIEVYGDRVILDIQGAVWSTFTDTNSMDPVIDEGANAIQIVPTNANEIEIGDIISYKSDYSDGTIIHRVIHKGEDEQGTYFIAKGDNLPTSDPGRIRFEQIKRVVIAIIY